MTESPQVVIRSRRAPAGEGQAFGFTRDMARVDGLDKNIVEYRNRAWEAFERTPFPSTQEEAWRRTDLKAFSPKLLRMPEIGAYTRLPAYPKSLLQPLTTGVHGGRVVLLAGGSQVQLDPQLEMQGVVFTDLLTAEKEHPELLAKVMGKVVSPEEGKFAGLSGALAQNGVLLYVPRGVAVEQPLQSLLWGPGQNLAYLSHILVYLEDGASVTYVHEAASPNEEKTQAMHAGLVELMVGEGASLKFVELQSWGEHVWNFSHEHARVGRGGTLDWIFGAVGSRLTKNFSELTLAGEGSTGKMSGFYFSDGIQHLDHDTQQNHLAPHTTSDLLFKGALLDQSRSVWQGMIYVAPGAQKTDGYQANRNLILSEQARADSIPGLEILADDVRCTHGATVGQLDKDQVFYLRSRGIPRDEAERLIVEGYFDPIMQRIPFEGVRERFQAAIHEKMKAYRALPNAHA